MNSADFFQLQLGVSFARAQLALEFERVRAGRQRAREDGPSEVELAYGYLAALAGNRLTSGSAPPTLLIGRGPRERHGQTEPEGAGVIPALVAVAMLGLDSGRESIRQLTTGPGYPDDLTVCIAINQTYSDLDYVRAAIQAGERLLGHPVGFLDSDAKVAGARL